MVVRTWPLLLRRDLAAISCDLSVTAFERAALDGTLPQPVLVGGEERWSLRAIEAAISVLTGETGRDWRAEQAELNHGLKSL